MRCPTPSENESSNARGGHTEHNETATSARGGNGIPSKRLSTTSWTIDKETLSLRPALGIFSEDRSQNLIMHQLLLWIELGNVLSSLGQFSLWVIVHLLCYEPVPHQLLPITCDLRHVSEVSQGLASLVQDLIHKEEAKVIDLFIIWVGQVKSGLEAMFEVITDVMLEEIPKILRI